MEPNQPKGRQRRRGRQADRQNACHTHTHTYTYTHVHTQRVLPQSTPTSIHTSDNLTCFTVYPLLPFRSAVPNHPIIAPSSFPPTLLVLPFPFPFPFSLSITNVHTHPQTQMQPNHCAAWMAILTLIAPLDHDSFVLTRFSPSCSPPGWFLSFFSLSSDF